jgi:hypothetical protein
VDLEERLSEKILRKNRQLTDYCHDSIPTNDTARLGKGQATHPMNQSQHPQGNTSPLGCKNRFGGHHGKVLSQLWNPPNQTKYM